ncbi:MAG: hypothetical protein ACLSBH_08615 [Coprobacillus cateniformis]
MTEYSYYRRQGIDASLLTDKDNRDLIEGLQMFYKWQGDARVF